MPVENFDGFYFLPVDEEEEGMKFAYFRVTDEECKGEPVGGTDIGDMFHIAFFKRGEDGDPVFDEHFEAIFADPQFYVEGLIGAELYGCVLRKTTKSGKWWNDYLEKTVKSCTLNKLRKQIKQFAESKT